MSFSVDGDLDLQNQLENTPSNASDQIALGKNGQWYPLHEFLMPALTTPFYLAFGIYGCLIFNAVISILWMIILFELCARYVSYIHAFTATILTAFTALLLNYSHSYSLDAFGPFMPVLAYLVLVQRRFMLGGLIWGLAIYARLVSIVIIPGFILYVFLETSARNHQRTDEGGAQSQSRADASDLALSGGGRVPVATCFFLINWLMFGSPITTSYDR